MSTFTKELAKFVMAAAPNARLNWFDYDFSLSVAHPTKDEAILLCLAPRPDIGQEGYAIPYSQLPSLAEWLRST